MHLKKVKIGQTLIVPPTTPEGKTRQGRVVRIHPLRRFYTVEFGEGNRRYRESFSCLTYSNFEIDNSGDNPPCFEQTKLKDFLWSGQCFR